MVASTRSIAKTLMDADEALRFVEELMRVSEAKPLNDLQRAIFKGAWVGKNYKEIHQGCNQVSLNHLMRNAGPKLWRALSFLASDLLGEPTEVRKEALQGPIERLRDRFQARETTALSPISFEQAQIEESHPWFPDHPINQKQDWGYAPSIPLFQGRVEECQELDQWIEMDACRLIALIGTTGIGKTALSVKLAEQLRDRFEVVIWRTLDPRITGEPPPLLQTLLTDLSEVISDQPNAGDDLTRFLECIRAKRCLIVVDGFDAVFHSKHLSGAYQAGYEAYGDLLKRVADAHHSSCLIITSREKPREVETREGMAALVRSYLLFGLQLIDVQNLFETKGQFLTSEKDWRLLVYQYDGNPHFLQEVAITILHAFGGDISRFLAFQEGQAIFVGAIRTSLREQVERLSDPEITIVQALAHYRAAASLEEIQQFVGSSLSRDQFLEVLLSLVRRSLLRSHSGAYFLNPLIAAFCID